MKTSPPRIMKSNEARAYVGGRLNLERLQAAGWVTPLGGKQRAMDYDRNQIDAALDRVRLTGWPQMEAMSESEGDKCA
ncbi:MAG: hypothetical protein IAE97_00345 [Chthoniobacterales bacterium]|nr:hypothetical protein [Chthoniobacterales bacterium]